MEKRNMSDDAGNFKRELGLMSSSALIAGSMIGTGIFFFVADVAVRLTSHLSIISCWLTGALIGSLGSMCLAELAAAYPQTGGIYVYLYRAYGPLVAFLYTWMKFLIMRVGSLGIPALAFATFFCSVWEFSPDMTELMKKIIAVIVIVTLTAINIQGVKTSGWVQNIFTLAKVMCLCVICGIGVSYSRGLFEGYSLYIEPVKHVEGSFLFLFCTALIPVMWTFGGWDESPFVAEEIIDPHRNLPLSICGGFCVVAVLYVAIIASYLLILSPAEMAASQGLTATLAMKRALGPIAGTIMAFVLMISTFGAVNGMTMTGARIAYATGRDQPLFRWFATTHAKTRTPVRSLIFQAILAVIVVILMANPFTLLLYTGMAYWGFSGLLAAAVIVMRTKDPTRTRPFHVIGYPFTPLIFIIASLGMAISVFVENWHNGMITLVILGVGVVAYYVQRVKRIHQYVEQTKS